MAKHVVNNEKVDEMVESQSKKKLMEKWKKNEEWERWKWAKEKEWEGKTGEVMDQKTLESKLIVCSEWEKEWKEWKSKNNPSQDGLLYTFQEDHMDMTAKFKNDALEELNLSKHPKADKLFEIAWKEGRACGYCGFNGVFEWMEKLSELL